MKNIKRQVCEVYILDKTSQYDKISIDNLLKKIYA